MRAGKYVILCVDDDPDILEYLRVVLEANGYAMAGASSAEEGLRAYRERPPDLIIADLMMEEIDSGTSFVKQLQAWGNRAPIYLLSSVGDNLNSSADYSALGLTGVLQKPLDSEVLLSLLKSKLQ
jgi:CheY-like chemotaxis protein